MVPIEEWWRLQRNASPDIKGLLLSEGPRFDEIVPDRGVLRRRRQSQDIDPE